MARGIPLDGATLERVAAVAIGEGRSPTETRGRLARGMDGGPPIELSAEVIRRAVKRIREQGETDVRPTALAARMLRLVERELASLEAKRGPTDLERLDKLAATLRRLEPLRPTADGPSQSRGGKPADLRSLVPGEGKPEGLGGLRSEAS